MAFWDGEEKTKGGEDIGFAYLQYMRMLFSLSSIIKGCLMFYVFTYVYSSTLHIVLFLPFFQLQSHHYCIPLFRIVILSLPIHFQSLFPAIQNGHKNG
jgi:hypothetical protein